MKNSIQQFWNSSWVLSITAGVLLGLSYPPVPLPFLIFPAFLLVFRIIDLSDSAREAAYKIYPAFLIWNIITTYWLVMATVAGGVAAILANAAVMTIPVMLQYKVQQLKISPWLIALLQTAFWLTYEFLHHQWDLAWPWLGVGNAWANVPQLVQYISVTGYWGISLWVIFTTALAYQYLKKHKQKTKIALISILLVFPAWSISISAFESETKHEQTHEVVVVQPNFDSYEPNGGFDSAQQANDHLLSLTDSVITENTQLIAWPENAVQNQILNIDGYRNFSDRTKKQLKKYTEKQDATLITGATFFEFYKDDIPALPYKGQRGAYLPFNAALGFYPDKPMEAYRKHNLVPIVERIPFVHFLNAIDVFGWVSWNQIQGYGKGHHPDQFSVNGTATPALICYDSVFPSWVRNYVENGSGYLTIITNDGWWGNTSGHEQHFAYARLRAIEFDRWIVRSANNGISGIIAPDGSIKIETPYWKSTAFNYKVPVLTSKTLYARFGDWLPYLMMILSIFGIGFSFFDKKSNST
ncbi:apolipoprotein N-acyltransferase [Aliifodinibius salipaludis]|uniref:Apolipoprotein N-acyltransferase n=1 Tax=Fodinibius salipaludis TaxID=2032627 RepID=A0A2A2GFT3_9BACT|nr:apolipoprotein N-acyltransferase [Aliifodinibius salipaludis]PAU95749.1 apolipoprotein N-acyltransferase [Aliifodinibius salipaludis]